jgi:putative flippase GtrA
MWQQLDHDDSAQSLGHVGVTHAIGYPDQRPAGEGWTLEYVGERLSLWRNERALPRYLAIAASEEDWFQRFEGDPEQALESVRSAGEVRVVAATQNRRSLLVPPATSAIRVAENWSEGWQFRVNGGSPQPVLRGRDISMVIPLANSELPSWVTLRYEPHRRTIGLWLSLLALATIFAAGLLVLRGPMPGRRVHPAATIMRTGRLFALAIQYAKFGSIGLLALATHVAIFAGLIEIFVIAPLTANILAFCVAVLVSFFGHFHWTFRAETRDPAFPAQGPRLAFARFVVVALLGLALNSLAVFLVVDIGGLPYQYAIPPMVFVVPPTVFAIAKLWAFRPA